MRIVSIAISRNKGTRKDPIGEGVLVVDHGLEGDAHAGDGHRQVSLLAAESIKGAAQSGLDVGFGDFGENLGTEGVRWEEVPVGTRIQLGDAALIEITQKGKECHRKCAIFYKAGDCIMPREGVFARVLKGGKIQNGEVLTILPKNNPTTDETGTTS